MLDKEIELALVRQYRPLLYLFFSQQSTYKYVVVGGASLEFLVNNSSIVDTSDVDIHAWTDAYKHPDHSHEKQLMDDLATRIRSYFTNPKFMKSNEGINNYFRSKTDSDVAYRSTIIPGTIHNHPTHRIQIYGVDIADIRYKYEDPSNYFQLYQIPTLTVGAYFYSQVEIFTQSHNQALLLNTYISSSVHTLARRIVDVAYGFAKTFKTPQKYHWDAINVYLDDIAKSMVYNMVDPTKEKAALPATRERLRTRYFKTCRRLAILLQFFDLQDSPSGKILFLFKKDWSSCTVLNKKKILDIAQNLEFLHTDIDYCDKKIVFNSDRPSPPHVFELNRTLLNTTHADFRNVDFRMFYPDIWRWTAKSTPITNECKTFYLKSLLGLSHMWNQEIKGFIQRLQHLLYKSRYSMDLELYKTSRVIVFNKNIDSLTLRRNSTVLQYFFNSTTTNRNLPTLLNFAGYEVGACAYIIRLPRNFPCMYVGSPERSAYASEQEIILPFGVEFKITNIRTETYIKKNREFYKLRTYEVDAVLPPPSICSPNGTIYWENVPNYIRKSMKKDCQMFNMPTPSVSMTQTPIPCPDTSATLYANATPVIVHHLQNEKYNPKEFIVMVQQLFAFFGMTCVRIWEDWVVPIGDTLARAAKATLKALALAIIKGIVIGSRWLANTLQTKYLKQ